MRITDIELLDEFVERGYLFRFPGGSDRSSQKKHASFGVIDPSVDQKRCVVMLAFNEALKEDYRKISPKPDENVFREAPIATLEREVIEETGIRIVIATLLESYPFEGHTKYGYRAKEKHCDFSNIRTKPEKPWLSEPLIIPLDYLLENDRWARAIYATHHWLFQKAFQFQLNQNYSLSL
jgi:8-oxo-dGTP pyrophosphatase MutT (NUDIX family)